MRYWPTVNTHWGRVGVLVELPDTPEVMIACREGLLRRENVAEVTPDTEKPSDVVLR